MYPTESPVGVEPMAYFVETAIDSTLPEDRFVFQTSAGSPSPLLFDEGLGELSFSYALARTGDEDSSGVDSFFEKGDCKDACVLS